VVDASVGQICRGERRSLVLRGEAPGRSHGVDVDTDGSELLRDGRLYQLVREHESVHERTLEIAFLEPGAEAYAFTFG
jgi:Thioredoxin like C-terminal domain